MSENKLLTPKELAKKLQISVSEIHKMVQEKQLPYYKLGHRTVRFDEAEIKEWLSSKKGGKYEFSQT